MAARANIAVTDGAGSPATHTFTPNGGLANGVLMYRNLDASVPAASEGVSLMVKDSSSPVGDVSQPGKKVSPRTVEIRLRDPVTYVDAVSGLTLVDFVNEVVLTFLIHPRASEQAGEDLRVMAGKLLTETNGNQITYAIDKGEHVW